MEWVELIDVEYGECVVLGGKNHNMLMVDCGSMNQKLRDGDLPMDLLFGQIAERYETFLDRYFLLTHYHRDHLCGFKKILEARPGYFTRIFLPATPMTARGVPLLLEFALFAFLFLPPQTDCAQINTSCVKIFQYLEQKAGADRIFTLSAGDLFSFDGVDYRVLWPQTERFPFPPELVEALEKLNILFSSPFLPEAASRFLRLKKEFLNFYVTCSRAFSISARALPDVRRQALVRLEDTLRELEGLREELSLCANAHDAREILQDPLNAAAFSDCLNASSLVFHNLRKKEAGPEDILMTGDIPPEILESLQDQLYDGYYILKAPHHGTASGWSPMFSDMSAAHILISNGEYHAGGAIAQPYIDLSNSVRHCTSSRACKWFFASEACCNRLTYCFDQTIGPGLVLKCPAVWQGTGKAGCKIRVITHAKERSCICEPQTKYFQ